MSAPADWLDQRLRALRAALAPRAWTWCLAVEATLLAVHGLAMRLFEALRPLASFRDRAIGSTTLLGVDASGYSRGYVGLVAGSCVLFLLCAALFARIQRRLSIAGVGRELRGELWFLQLSSLFVTLALTLSFVSRLAGTLAAAWTLVGFQVLAVALGALCLLLLRSPDPTRRSAARQLGRPPLLVHALAIALAIGLPLWSILAASTRLERLAGPVAFLLFAILAGVLGWRTARATANAGPDRRPLSRRLLHDLPLLLLPFTPFAANELGYRLPRARVDLLVVTLTVLVVALVPLLRRLTARRSPPSAQRLATAVYLPMAITALALASIYVSTASTGELDTFHLGELSLPTHQLFRFGVMPLADLRLTHTLSDLVYPSLYTLLHGFRAGAHALDMLMWMQWLPAVVAMPLLYAVIAAFTTPLFALLLCLATPALALVDPYYGMALIPALLLGRYAKRPSGRSLALVWLGLLWLLAWRIDFGLAGAVAALSVLVARSLAPPRLGFRSLVRSTIPAAAVAASAVAALAVMSPQPLLPALARLVESYTYRLATRARADLFSEYGMLVALQYYLLPAVGVAVVVSLVARLLLVSGRLRYAGHSALFLALFSLVISVRSLERHALIEAFNGYLFFLLLVLLPAVLTVGAPAATRRRALPVVLGLFLLRLLIMMPPAGPTTGFFAVAELLPPAEGFPLDARGDRDEPRFSFDRTPFTDLLAFLDRHLGEDQTFFDFTNSPALHVLADRRFPTWMIPTLSATSETLQTQILEELETWRADGRLPFVVFKQGTHWDTFEGMAAEVRSYRIAEWVYRFYRPLVRLRGFEVWQDLRDEPIPVDWRTIVELPIRERIAGASIEVDELSRREGLVVRTGDDDPYLYGFLRMRDSPELSTRDHWVLEIDGRSSISQLFQIFYTIGEEDFSDRRTFTVRADPLPDGETQLWRLPLDEPSGVVTDLRIDPPENAELQIRSVRLVGTEQERAGLVESGVSQSFDLQGLPRVWAELDPRRAVAETAPIATLLSSPVLIRPGGSMSLPLGPGLDRTTVGYALLRIRSARNLLATADTPTRVYLRYDQDDCCGFVFDLTGPSLGIAGGAEDGVSSLYLVRLASQWRWSHGEVASLRVWTDEPAVLERVELRGLD